MTSNITRAYEIADEYRSRGVKVVFRGHPRIYDAEEASKTF